MPATTIGKYRWTIVVLLFFATTINYMDRQVIGLLKDTLADSLKWTEKDYSHIVMAFTASYALGLLFFGRIIDKIGTKLGYTISVIIWSLSAMAHALVRSTLGFGMARSALGLGESGNFPAAIKAVAEWFPKKERALATGIFNSGSNIAAILGPPLVAFLLSVAGPESEWGWRSAFLVTGALGFIWLIFWRRFFGSPNKWKGRRLSEVEYDYIHADEVDEGERMTTPVSLKRILEVKQTWAFFLGKFLTDPVWWFYLFWVPSYIDTTFHMHILKSWIYVSVIYMVASFGSILGGYLSGWLIRKGIPEYRARKTVMLIFAFCVLPIFLIRFTNEIWVAVGLISLAAAAHQAWSANIFTTASDMFPKRAVSTVVGIGGMAGSLGGVLFPLAIGIILDHFKTLGQIGVGYNIIFAICAVAYLVAWVAMHFLCPRMVRIRIA